jgi:hypothetical protein
LAALRHSIDTPTCWSQLAWSGVCRGGFPRKHGRSTHQRGASAGGPRALAHLQQIGRCIISFLHNFLVTGQVHPHQGGEENSPSLPMPAPPIGRIGLAPGGTPGPQHCTSGSLAHVSGTLNKDSSQSLGPHPQDDQIRFAALLGAPFGRGRPGCSTFVSHTPIFDRMPLSCASD